MIRAMNMEAQHRKKESGPVSRQQLLESGGNDLLVGMAFAALSLNAANGEAVVCQ